MANTTVTKVSELLLTNVTAGIKAGDQKVSEGSGFTEVMNNAKDSTAKVAPVKGDDVAKTRTVVETPKNTEIKSEETVRKDPISNENDMKDLTEEVAEEVTSIINKIKEVLNVSDEEIETAMEDLGLTAASLIDPMNVKDLCMEITGTPDSISLLTNAELYDNIKEIVQTAEDAVSQITAQFDLTPDQALNIFKDESFKDAVEDAISILQNRSEAPELQPNEAVVPTEGMIQNQMPIQDTDVETKAEVVKPLAEQSNTDTNVTVNTDTATKTVTVEVNREADTKPIVEERPATETDDPLARTTVGTTETFKAATKPEQSNLKENEFKESDNKGQLEEAANTSRFVDIETATATVPQQTTVVNTEVNNLGQVVETVTTYSNGQAESIMSQVTESIRVNYQPDTTSMEMQLHPASLGTVNMQVASTNGVVTAHILVQSEAVKAALESQLITLQQTFDEQGMKVEAVEVSVANYDLNRGTGSETGSNSEEQNHGRTGRVGTRRRINLNDLAEEDLEELTEDEKLSADMMARSGNSLDYKA